jgi:predicted anti-sigma-YlaC factor YlaD
MSFRKTVVLSLIVLFQVSCSLNKMVVNGVADALSKGGGTTFTGENDPELVGDALPFALKFYDSILEQAPEHEALLLSTGSAYVMYANAYLHSQAQMLSSKDFEKKDFLLKRARNLYLRGRDMVIKGLSIRHPQLRISNEQKQFEESLKDMNREDVSYLYWASAGWMAAYSLNTLDINVSIGVPKVTAMMRRALELNDEFDGGAIHDFFISFYASMPVSMGGSPEKAREHFKRAVEISKGRSASPYVSLATSLCVKNQNEEEFQNLLNQALQIDPEADKSKRLVNILSQRKAKWYLAHQDDFFIR